MKSVKQILRERHMDTSLIPVHIDERSFARSATWFIFNLTGQIVGVHQFRPDADKVVRNDPRDSRFFTFFTAPDGKETRMRGVWGAESLGWRADGPVVIAEGVFDACRFHNVGIPAIAVLSNDPRHLTQTIDFLRKTRTVIGALDNDPAGQKLAKFCDLTMTPSREGADFGDLTAAEFAHDLFEFSDQHPEIDWRW